MTADEKFMKAAVTQAKRAYQRDETPIGCVIVFEDKIIARGYNKRNWKKNTLAHAEIIAINKASRVLGDWRLEDCTMYVTLEPCPMCPGPDSTGGHGKYESKGRVCRLGYEYFADSRLQSSGGAYGWCTSTRVQPADDFFF